eukprot:TRINITY_DN2464_c0_g1_i1.p1 TRINITY_DN2464_c0_g1~~TRINITY_DN2464_c0_g1_i1.p1  ORF type:complete len:194 (-),score=25.53 TRINITY_DN2464_c0_g1_i1:9-590(-)
MSHLNKRKLYKEIFKNEGDIDLLCEVLSKSSKRFKKIQNKCIIQIKNRKASRKFRNDRAICVKYAEHEFSEWMIKGLNSHLKVRYEHENDRGRYICFDNVEIAGLECSGYDDMGSQFRITENILTLLCRALCLPFSKAEKLEVLIPNSVIDIDVLPEDVVWESEQVSRIVHIICWLFLINNLKLEVAHVSIQK